ncbi:MAG: hypothetical protein H7281_18840 [Bacteriovorax sp.]|nr:hypothetical protein [Bacteriovorax sp.]
MKIRSSLSILLFLTLAVCPKAWSCGEYLASAQVIMKDGVSSLVINPDSKSEINLKVDFNESSKLSPYIGRMIEADVKIEEKMDFTRGLVASIGTIKVIAPDPLAHHKGTSLKLLKKIDCKK